MAGKFRDLPKEWKGMLGCSNHMLSKIILSTLFHQVNAISSIEFGAFSPVCDEQGMITIPVILPTSLLYK